MSKNNTIARMKRRKELKSKIIKYWYFLMKPVAMTFDEIDKLQDKIHRYRVSKITDDKAIDMYIKILLKSLFNYDESFVIAHAIDWEYDNESIIDKMRSQNKNKVLRTWAYNIKDNKVINKELTNALYKKLKEYPDIRCEYFQSNRDSWNSRGYETTLVISLKSRV